MMSVNRSSLVGLESAEKGAEPLPACLLKGLAASWIGTLDRSLGNRSEGLPRVMIAYDDRLYQACAVVHDIGPLPQEEELVQFTDLFRDAGRSADQEVRDQAARWFLSHHRNFDPYALGALDVIDERGCPCSPSPSWARLIFLSGPPGCAGLQVECFMEPLRRGSDRHEFLVHTRQLMRGPRPVTDGSAVLLRTYRPRV